MSEKLTNLEKNKLQKISDIDDLLAEILFLEHSMNTVRNKLLEKRIELFAVNQEIHEISKE